MEMAKEIIRQKAADNTYLHRDFHIALNYGLDYLNKKFSEDAVREYLTQFANSYYSPLKRAIQDKGLLAIKEHYEKIFEIEGARFDIRFSQDELIIHLLASPAVLHIKAQGHPVSESYYESVATVNKTICQETPFDIEMLEYHEDNGSYRVRFFRRQQ
jgi:hypothetical protein